MNPSLSSSCRALVKVIPTTSGSATVAGVAEAVGLPVGLTAAVLAGGAEREVAGDNGRDAVGGAGPPAAGAVRGAAVAGGGRRRGGA